MSTYKITPKTRANGEIKVPGDKSISHRGIIIGSISNGVTSLSGFLDSADCRATVSCFKKTGIQIEKKDRLILVHGKGLKGLKPPAGVFDVQNSGTTMRLMSGILAAAPFSSEITGDSSIQKRPMKRIMDPLNSMGAGITSKNSNNCAPLLIEGKKQLSGIHWHSPVASAQVKSAILLAGLYASGDTTVTEPAVSRDHTERMLKAFGADIETEGTSVTIHPGKNLNAIDIIIPGDISSAAPFLAAGLLLPHGGLTVKNVNINPTRSGFLEVIKQMGAALHLDNIHTISHEEVCDITVSHTPLHGVRIGGDLIPTLIDELPVIAILAAYAKGTTVICDASELRVKESDRIALLTENLLNMGADVTPNDDGMTINGGLPLRGTTIRTASDHRIAMAFAICGLLADGTTIIDDMECVNISYPGFFTDLEAVVS